MTDEEQLADDCESVKRTFARFWDDDRWTALGVAMCVFGRPMNQITAEQVARMGRALEALGYRRIPADGEFYFKPQGGSGKPLPRG